MSRIPTRHLGRYLLQGQLPRKGCLASSNYTPRGSCRVAASCSCSRCLQPFSPQATRAVHVSTSSAASPADTPIIPLRKKLKDEAKQLKKESRKNKAQKGSAQTVDGWELTVGIEIHAQLNTSRKLFSPAATSFNDEPNSHVALFDLSIPGSQPLFQPQTLIPALRAALALNCDIQPVSRFDRKHYFWWDQPSGYQITQYYEPLARNGSITLLARDGIAPEDGDSVTVGIQQIQLEQDTAKTLAQPGDARWLDFNRVGVPLIEIITRPEIHHPRTAAVLVRKIQLLLNAVDACVSGMETGGLRADVNVSVRRTGDTATGRLGTRTEVKNLSTIKAVEDAIIAERDRQIAQIEAGGSVVGETRGWTLGSKQTRRLRGKEGEVDYRYMPDPDLGPLLISEDLVRHIKESVAHLPDRELDELVDRYGVSAKDAVSLMALDNGARIEYFYNVVGGLGKRLREAEGRTPQQPLDLELDPDLKKYAPLAANWILHEFGRLVTDRSSPQDDETAFEITPEGQCARVPVASLSELLFHLHQKKITGKVAKELLLALYHGNVGEAGGVTAAIDAHDLWFHELSEEEYGALVESALEGEDRVLKEFGGNKKTYPQGKLMYLVGKMLRLGPTERIDPVNAEKAMRSRIEELCGTSA
ncbi:aspartyl/glutamyl-tRNA amidotransferase subunit B [Sodiomyces alkalinus F11]|uniref:Glutamyl-tRNA(Gln) amidotransferase subunit B, mitochondrial n=1 Tax=Sodiomyces alkalinus (strain CBS 110278 / VKM F-3762 / F11) TaxID=1314773 RepID=A0A3N2PV64_SODAK|nr:aspartyl/glutamyl-tRNA amidotransferase subunit B [Sodiomyces alkalinus F11]ROT38397.1 aspartyl/glutamyl-tRNA amidotransferase subunit B [Sodiomyces alkalinus F11]